MRDSGEQMSGSERDDEISEMLHKNKILEPFFEDSVSKKLHLNDSLVNGFLRGQKEEDVL